MELYLIFCIATTIVVYISVWPTVSEAKPEYRDDRGFDCIFCVFTFVLAPIMFLILVNEGLRDDLIDGLVNDD